MLTFFECMFLISFIALFLFSVGVALGSDETVEAIVVAGLIVLTIISIIGCSFCQIKDKPLTTTQKIQKLESKLNAYNEILYIEEKSGIELSSDSKQKILDKYLKED